MDPAVIAYNKQEQLERLQYMNNVIKNNQDILAVASPKQSKIDANQGI